MSIEEKKSKSAKTVPLPNIYESPEYWCGDIGYRPPGYGDFAVNTLKEIAIILQCPQSVLDIGCAFGYTVGRLNTLGIPSKGIDISKYAISQATDSVKENLIQAPAWELPFNDKQFDFAFSSGVLEHIPKDKLQKTVSEITRVCKRGLLAIAVWDDETTHKEDDETHELLFWLRDWKQIFPESFEIISDSTASWRVKATIETLKASVRLCRL